MISYPYKLRLKTDDVALLLPAFQPVVEKIFAHLQDLGFEPVVFDTLRTQAEADHNAAKGTGSKNSMHLYGAACDLVCNQHSWKCHVHGCKFYEQLRQLALKHAYIGPEGDFPHFQALPVSQQALFRRLTESQRNAFARVWLMKRG
jgi:hypothetical protein